MQELVSESLQIVGEELAVTFNDVRRTLEQYADGGGDGPAGQQLVDRCLALLHSANGALRVTETYGASLLTEEMEGACRHLVKLRRQDGPTDEAMEALSRAAVQLPAYVELIINGGRDIPLVLLPLLNDLRAACGRPLLSESTLLLLNVNTADINTAEAVGHEVSGEDVADLCKELRPRFQLALLGWIKGSDVEASLKKLAGVAERLENAATTREVHQLWWIVGGVVEALLNRGLETSVALKRLMGHADREMKRLPTLGEQQYAAQEATELVNNFLYYISRSTTNGLRVGAIRAVFNLSDLVPGDDHVEMVRESLSAPSVKLMHTVAQAIRDDLARVKDVLDIYVRTGMEHIEELAPQIELLKKIGDTMGVLGLGDLRETIQAKRCELQSLIDTGGQVSEPVLEEMAIALLNVEDRLEAQLFELIRPASAIDSDQTEAETPAADVDTDYDTVMQAVMREAIVNLAHVKDAVVQMLDRPEDGVSLDSVPQNFRGIVAGLMITEKNDAVVVVEKIGRYIDKLIKQGYSDVSKERLDLLADAIVSLEYYLETLQAGRKEPGYMLDNANTCLAAIEDAESKVLRDIPDSEFSGLATTMQIPGFEPTQVVPILPSEQTAVVSNQSEERIDPELLELFIEEAKEEFEPMQSSFAKWAEDAAQIEALGRLRNSFHKLKGSGRVVGAELIGDFCWSAEDLLNRVINGTLAPSGEIVDLTREAVAALPELLEQLEVGNESERDVQQLMQDLAALAKGRSLAAIASEASDDEEPGSGVEIPVLDPVLLEILAKETGMHLSVLSNFVAECRESIAPYPITEEVHRACHTLHGSVTMARAIPAESITEHLNRIIRNAFDHDVAIEESAVSACERVIEAMRLIIEALDGTGTTLPETDALEAELRVVGEEIEAAVVRAEAENAVEDSLRPGVTADELAASAAAKAESEVEIEPSADITLDIDPEIAGIYAEEAAELLEGIDTTLARLTTDEMSDADLAELQRLLHTLKGGARMVGLVAMGDLSHDLETLLIRIGGGEFEQSGEQLGLVRETVDELHRSAEQIAHGKVYTPLPELRQRLQGIAPAADAVDTPQTTPQITPETVEPSVPVEASAPVETEIEEDIEPAEASASEEAEPEAVEPADTEQPDELFEPPILPPADEKLGQLAKELEAPAQPQKADLGALVQAPASAPAPERRDLARVDQKLLESLLNNAGEVSIFHSRLSQQMSLIQFNLEELGQTVVRLRDQLRNLEMATEAQILYQHHTEVGRDSEPDPLQLERYSKIQQLSRSLGETTSDVASIKDLLQELTGDTEALLVQQARTAGELQDGLMHTRMVPFQRHTNRLARLVRQVATEHGKQVELQVLGSGDIDRQVLEKILPPIEHMLRNAIVHGIEASTEREAAGKPSAGQITIALKREGSQIVIEISDDGAGIDVDAVRRKAVELGMVDADADITEEQIVQFILRAGFSTADQVTHAAGRGVGMDVVASEITNLGGTLRTQTKHGHGTTFTVRLPFTLAVTQALIVRAASEMYAIPLPTVEGIIRISRKELEQKLEADDPSIEYGGRSYQIRHLGQYLGLGASKFTDEVDRISIVIVEAGSNSTALVADEMLDSREIVVKPVGTQLSSIAGVSGATIMGDGRVVVILDAGALVRTTIQPATALERETAEEPDQLMALVVDDSITMRRVTQRLLERNDMRVVTAKDGVEAITMLREHPPDIILLDIEMPRMDGYQFAKHVRNESAVRDVPIIMITSRVSDEHKARAIELGVNDYLGKPYQESALLEAVNHLLHPEESGNEPKE